MTSYSPSPSLCCFALWFGTWDRWRRASNGVTDSLESPGHLPAEGTEDLRSRIPCKIFGRRKWVRDTASPGVWTCRFDDKIARARGNELRIARYRSGNFDAFRLESAVQAVLVVIPVTLVVEHVVVSEHGCR